MPRGAFQITSHHMGQRYQILRAHEGDCINISLRYIRALHCVIPYRHLCLVHLLTSYRDYGMLLLDELLVIWCCYAAIYVHCHSVWVTIRLWARGFIAHTHTAYCADTIGGVRIDVTAESWRELWGMLLWSSGIWKRIGVSLRFVIFVV